ncbi:MAG: glycosyltransferase [Syntrophobacterales bacterium]|nr:glycosyltransferase [Syntrophobacterales bacterium]
MQLPLYNERFVAERLLDSVAEMEWPQDKFEIQVLDDSTDDTREIVDERAAFLSGRGVMINVIRRPHRQGYKAGALDNGMKQCRGEFIAIFDADFVPGRDFLLKTIPGFDEDNIGMVQARWGFLNTEHSWLTSIQSLLLGPHFRFEHWVRYKRNLFFNFNGTAGVWRKRAIESAGGWLADTITEDLDLSYRAQLAGWRFRYLDTVEVPSELPVTMTSFRCQQERWAKGSIQTAKKILPLVLRANIPISVKLEAVAHLLANVCWLLGLMATLTLYPVILSRPHIGPYQIIRLDVPIFIFSSLAIFFYFVIFRLTQKKRVPLHALFLLPIFTIGLAPSLAIAVAKGFFRQGGVFERTAKFGIRGRGRMPVLAWLYSQKSFKIILINTILFIYTLQPILLSYQRGTWPAIPFLLLFPMGFFLVMYRDFIELLPTRPALVPFPERGNDEQSKTRAPAGNKTGMSGEQ